MFLRKWIVRQPVNEKPRRGAIIIFPGRGIPGNFMIRFCREMKLCRTTLACMEPYKLAWYPKPNGAEEQGLACLGLEKAMKMVNHEISKFLKWQELSSEETVLLGFSAGAVIAIQAAIQSNIKFAACISMSGAILDPQSTAEPKNETPIFIQHNKDDSCFSWEERYLPMREVLTEKGYNVIRSERAFGEHRLYRDDAINISKFIGPKLGYSKKYLVKKFG